MRPDMRAELEAAAQKRAQIKAKRGINWNVSQELLFRLRWSLEKEREERRDPATRALSYLISRVAQNVQHDSLSKPWHLDPFTFRAFTLGVFRVLAALAPRGEVQPPDVSASRVHVRVFQNEGERQLGPTEQAEYLHRAQRQMADRFKTPESAAEWAAESVIGNLFITFDPEARSSMRAVLARAGLQATFEALEETMYADSDARRDLGIKLKEPKS
jgi:hypothetical protein